MSGICDTCKRKECYMQHDGDDSCPLYIKGKPSHYKRLFGTPERAARTLAGKCSDCCECALVNTCEHGSGEGCLLSDESNCDKLLKWLRSAE